ncbi:hypothetical protein DFH09DRAFT_1055234, partial [Mycena vulgaris]
MVVSKSLTKTCRSPSWICHTRPRAPLMIPSSPTISQTSTRFPPRSAFHGNYPRITTSAARSHSRVSSGISSFEPWHLARRRRQNTFSRSQSGSLRHRIPSRQSGSSTGSSYTLASLLQWDALISPTWRPCWGSSTIVLTSRAPLPLEPPTIWNGGSRSSLAPPLPVPSLAPAKSSIAARFRMPVRVPESLSCSTAAGVRGGFCPDGMVQTATSGGLRPLVSNFLSTPLSAPPAPHDRRILKVYGLKLVYPKN